MSLDPSDTPSPATDAPDLPEGNVWDDVGQPLTLEFHVITNRGPRLIKMREPMDEDLKHLDTYWPYPQVPTKVESVPFQNPDGTGRKMIDKVVEDDDPEVVKEYRIKRYEVHQVRLMAYAEASLLPEYKPRGATPKERVDHLLAMPPIVKQKILAKARWLSESRLQERFDEAKKD
jgi:hypothetical protein